MPGSISFSINCWTTNKILSTEQNDLLFSKAPKGQGSPFCWILNKSIFSPLFFLPKIRFLDYFFNMPKLLNYYFLRVYLSDLIILEVALDRENACKAWNKSEHEIWLLKFYLTKSNFFGNKKKISMGEYYKNQILIQQ